MKYFIISDSDSIQEIGYHPQTDLNPGYNPTLNNACYKMSSGSLSDYDPHVELRLHNKSKRTNFIDKSAGLTFGIVIDERFKNILTKFKLPKHKFYPISVFHKDRVYEYYWFHFLCKDIFNFIDKEKSTLKIVNIRGFVVEKIVEFPKTTEALISIKEMLPYNKEMFFNEVYFTEDYPNYDVLRFSSAEGQFLTCLFSERLVNALKKENISGFNARHFKTIL